MRLRNGLSIRSFFYKVSVFKCIDNNTAFMFSCAGTQCTKTYCNTLLYGTTERVLHPMQVVLNAAARLVVGAGRRDLITPILLELHALASYSTTDSVQDGGPRFPLYPSVCPDVSLPYVYIHGRRSWTMSPEVRTPRRGRCTANFHEAIWASQLPLCWPDSLEQFAVRTEGQGNYTLSMFRRKLKTFLFSQAFS